jgi:ferredoxin
VKTKIFHYRSNCIGCFGCVAVAPERWQMSRKDGKSILIGASEKKGIFSTELFEEEVEQNRQAASTCPSRVIRIVEY